MKKSLVLLLVSLLSFSIVACASSADGTTKNIDNIYSQDISVEQRKESSGTTDIQNENNENEDVVEESIEEVELPRMNSYTADDNGYCASFDVVKFGSYEQDGDETNGTEAIEWYVIAREDGKALLLSKYILEGKEYKYDESDDVTWENSDLRIWLNEDFYNNSFIDIEKKYIMKATLNNDDNPVWNTFGGNKTEDNVFILSINEIKNYFDLSYKNETSGEYDYASEELICFATDKAYKTLPSITSEFEYTEERTILYFDKLGYTNKKLFNTTQPFFWVRNPGGRAQYDVCYCRFGYICEDVYMTSSANYGVRPAIWVDEAALTMYQ